MEPPKITPVTIPLLVASISNVPPSERRRSVLLFIADRTLEPRQVVPWADLASRWLDLGVVSENEIQFWAGMLRDEGLITYNGDGCILTPRGIIESEVLAVERRDLKQVFVAMAFGGTPLQRAEAVALYNDGLKLGVEGSEPNLTGLRSKRIDLEETNEKLCEEIIVEIRRSRAIIADITHERPNVYYEAGYAHGLGLPVIFTCDETKFKPHFDTQQYKTICWANPTDLAKKLELRIRATIL
jgi:hypothetical protein